MSSSGTPQSADPEELGALRDRGADEEAAVRAAADGRGARGDVHLSFDEVLGRGDEVVEDVLLLEEHPGLVPLLAVLAAAAQVRDRVDAAALEPREERRAEARASRDTWKPP